MFSSSALYYFFSLWELLGTRESLCSSMVEEVVFLALAGLYLSVSSRQPLLPLCTARLCFAFWHTPASTVGALCCNHAIWLSGLRTLCSLYPVPLPSQLSSPCAARRNCWLGANREESGILRLSTYICYASISTPLNLNYDGLGHTAWSFFSSSSYSSLFSSSFFCGINM